jgi:hypothetical protein
MIRDHESDERLVMARLAIRGLLADPTLPRRYGTSEPPVPVPSIDSRTT